MLGRAGRVDVRPAGDGPAVVRADQDRLLALGEGVQPLLPRLLARGQPEAAEHRRALLVLRQGEVERRSAARPRPRAGRGSRSRRAGVRRPWTAPPGCRAPAAAPKPSRNQASSRAGVVRGTTAVVAWTALVDPARRGERVEVAHVLRLLDGVAGRLDPDVRAPHRVVARRADEVADEPPVAQPGGARGGLAAPDALQLLARRGRLLVARREQRLGLAVARVAGREQARWRASR